MAAHTHRFTVALHDCDPAGVLFFAHLLRHAHDVYESFMATLGHDLPSLIRDGVLALPIVHAEADFSAPLRHGDAVTVELAVERVGEGAFTLGYRFLAHGGVAATARTVHAAASEGVPHPLPAPLRSALAAHR